MAAFDRNKYKVTDKASSAFSAAAPCRYGEPTVKSYKTETIPGNFNDGSNTFPFVKDVDFTGINIKIGGEKPTVGEFGGTPSFAQELFSKDRPGEYLLFKFEDEIHWCQVTGANSRELVLPPESSDNVTNRWKSKYGDELKAEGVSDGLPNDAKLHRLILLLCGGGGSAGGWAYYDVAKNSKSDDNHIIPGTGGGGGGFGVCILNLDHLTENAIFNNNMLVSGKYFRIKVGAGGALVKNRNYYYSHNDFKAGYNGNNGEDSFVRLESIQSNNVTKYQVCTASGGIGGVGARTGSSEYADFDGERFILTAKNGFGNGGKWYWGNSTGNDRTNTGWIDQEKTIYYIAGNSETTGGRGSNAGVNKNIGDDREKIISPATSQIFWLPGIPQDIKKNDKAHKVCGVIEEYESYVADEKKYTNNLVVNGGNSLGSGCHYLSTPEEIQTNDGKLTLHFKPAQMGGGGACAGNGFEAEIAGKGNWVAPFICIGLGTAILIPCVGQALGPILLAVTVSAAVISENIGIGKDSPGAGQPAPGYAALFY